MKNPLLLSVAALALAAAALITGWMDFGGAATPAIGSGALPGGLGDVDQRIEALAAENQALRKRLSELELVPARGPSQRATVAGDYVEREEFAAFQEEMRAALAGSGPLAAKGDAGWGDWQDKVASTLNEIRHQEAVDKARSQQEKRLDRLDETMPKVEQWLELTGDQSRLVRSAFLAQYEREAELTRRWEAGEDNEVLGQIKQADRETHFAELAGILTPAQLETYTSRVSRSGK